VNDGPQEFTAGYLATEQCPGSAARFAAAREEHAGKSLPVTFCPDIATSGAIEGLVNVLVTDCPSRGFAALGRLGAFGVSECERSCRHLTHIDASFRHHYTIFPHRKDATLGILVGRRGALVSNFSLRCILCAVVGMVYKDRCK
jgi:hypothetical protein